MSFIENSCDVTLKKVSLGGLFCGNKKVVNFFIGTMDVEFSKSTTLQQISDYIKAGKLMFFPNHDSIEDADKDPQYASNTFQEDIFVGGGIKGWNLMWNQGVCFQNEIAKLYDLKGYGVGLVMEDGTVIVKRKKNGAYGLYEASFLEKLYKVRTGADMAGSGLGVQLKYIATNSWQRESANIESTEIDFRDVTLTTGLRIEFAQVVAGPSDTVKVTVKQACHNSNVEITGTDKFSAYKNGELYPVFAFTYDPLTKIYTLDFGPGNNFVSGDKLQIVTMDALGNTTIQIGTAYYYGESEIITVD